MPQDYKIRMVHRETLRYEDSTLHCEMMCFYDPKGCAYTVVIPLKGQVQGKSTQFSSQQMELIESRVKDHLGKWRLFGIPIRSYGVNVLH